MTKENYPQLLHRTLSVMIDRLELDEFRKEALKSRWLEQLIWLENSAIKAQRRFYALRLIVIVGGSLVPALISLNSGEVKKEITWIATGMAQSVAVSAAVEELFGFKLRYRIFRNTAEGLRVEGWQFFQLVGHYQEHRSHSEAYAQFAGRVEGLIRQDFEVYFAQYLADEKEHTPRTGHKGAD